jgi:hypothetical protein
MNLEHFPLPGVPLLTSVTPDFHKGIKLKDLFNYLNKSLFVAFHADACFLCAEVLLYFIM